MEDMLLVNDIIKDNFAESLKKLLLDHNGQDVTLLDLRKINNWTDFFIITTVTSKTHMEGLEKHIKDFCKNNNLEIIGKTRTIKNTEDALQNYWRIIDLGFIVIHLMTNEARNFYELERIWH